MRTQSCLPPRLERKRLRLAPLHTSEHPEVLERIAANRAKAVAIRMMRMTTCCQPGGQCVGTCACLW